MLTKCSGDYRGDEETEKKTIALPLWGINIQNIQIMYNVTYVHKLKYMIFEGIQVHYIEP